MCLVTLLEVVDSMFSGLVFNLHFKKSVIFRLVRFFLQCKKNLNHFLQNYIQKNCI